MPIKRSFRASTLLTLMLLGCAPANYALADTAASSQAVVRQTVVKHQLDQLADAFYRARVKFDPLQFATINGDGRYGDQLGLSIAPKNRARYFASIHALQKQLQHIVPATLPEKEQLNYALLSYELESALHFEHFPEHLLPLNQLDNVPSTLANFASGDGAQALTTVKEYQAYLRRLQQLPSWIDQAIVNMREGLRLGIVQPKAITTAMLPQFQQLHSKTVEASIFYTPITHFPKQFSHSDQQKLRTGFATLIRQHLNPSLQKLVQFLEHDYLAAGRSSTGYSDLPNGAAWYQMRIKDNTTTDLNSEQIHALGLQEVARIQAEFPALGVRLGYSGAPKDLPLWVAAQVKFKPFTTDAQVLERYRQIDTQVRVQLPKLFSLLPKGELELQLEPELSRATASDHYTPPSADGTHKGVFWPVVNDPRQYDRTGMVTLFLHEGQPGHHLHGALLKEMSLPDFRKFNTENLNSAAFTEGWALYAESMGKELGLYDDPEAYFGYLRNDLLRAVRLVVDTGMHTKGWTREEAITYMQSNLGFDQARAKNQVERYMVWPGQALSYKIGASKILELRARAEKALGAKFSLAKFHAVVIGDGTLPLPILEQRVDQWISRSL
ncbi:MAG: DUF885 domain-containing protein [Undibacterium sp.]|nr:DUF885 domain-containing protein [Undibacterium sp.]